MSETTEKVAHTVGVAIGSVIVLILLGLIITVGLLISGWVLSTMWGWFVVPLGLPALGLVHAMGLALLVRYLTWQHGGCKREETDNERLARQMIVGFVYPFGVLGLAWVIHSFM